jgi:capsular exopolysaccharide synthesis family protein
MLNQKESPSEAYNIKEFILTALPYKYYYLVCFVVCMSIALMINKFSPVVIRVNSIIGPIEDKRPSLRGSSGLFNGVADYSQVRNLENDINSLTSFSLVSTTIKTLNLEVGYFIDKTNIFGHPNQIYQGSSYTVNIDKSHLQPINARFYIKLIDDKSYRLRSSEKEVTLYNYVDNYIVSRQNVLKIDTICKFNETVQNKYFQFSVFRNKDSYDSGAKYENLLYFEFYHQDLLSQEYLKKLKVEPVSVKSSLIKVSFQGENIDLTIDFLNNYLKAYLDADLAKKNLIASSTISFIDKQISETSDSLSKSESKLKDYRSVNQVTNLSYQGQQALEQMTKIEADKSALLVQERYYKYLLEYLEKNKDVTVLQPPSSANVNDPIMNSLVIELQSLNSQRASLLSNNSGKNLFLGQIENKIKLQKQAIIENVTNSLNTLNLSENELNYRAEKLSGEISKLPRTELNMVSMQRKFNLSDAIYTFLLQKRAESEITLASNIPDYEIMEPARETSRTVLSPKTMINYLAAIFLAFMGPTLFIILKKYFNEKITSVSDVQRLMDRNVFGIIYSNSTKTEAVVPDFPGSSIAESFRNLRSSLFLRLRSEAPKVILVTSAQPREGKSFIAFNLAASIASVGHKTIILDCDLRRPTLHLKFKEANSTGLSVYMAKQANKDEIIKKTFVPNLSFIPAGPQLPNPSELMESGILDDLITTLKSKFDYIILDTTPAGIVADAFQMMKHASQILVVCRNNYTRKDVFIEVINNLQSNKFANYDVVFNDLDLKRSQIGAYNSYYHKE